MGRSIGSGPLNGRGPVSRGRDHSLVSLAGLGPHSSQAFYFSFNIIVSSPPWPEFNRGPGQLQANWPGENPLRSERAPAPTGAGIPVFKAFLKGFLSLFTGPF